MDFLFELCSNWPGVEKANLYQTGAILSLQTKNPHNLETCMFGRGMTCKHELNCTCTVAPVRFESGFIFWGFIYLFYFYYFFFFCVFFWKPRQPHKISKDIFHQKIAQFEYPQKSNKIEGNQQCELGGDHCDFNSSDSPSARTEHPNLLSQTTQKRPAQFEQLHKTKESGGKKITEKFVKCKELPLTNLTRFGAFPCQVGRRGS